MSDVITHPPQSPDTITVETEQASSSSETNGSACSLPDSEFSSDGSLGRRRFFAWVSWIPSAVVVAGLGGLAWYGHHYDWKLPTAAASEESSTVDGKAWCESHNVPEAECINCLSGLIEDPPELTFCKRHGVHGCVLCDPSLAETKEPVNVTEEDRQRAARALALRQRRENLSLSQLPGSRIQFASIEAIRRSGVDVEPVQRRAIVESLQAAGEIQYDATQTAQVSPAADGIVKQVDVNVGDWVEAGQVLAIVSSEKVGRLKAELLSSLSDERLKLSAVRRLEPLAERDVIPGKRLLESQAAWQQASADVDRAVRALTNLGFDVKADRLRALSPEDALQAVRALGMKQITQIGASDNLIAVSAPLSGRVVERQAVVGEVVNRGTPMFLLSDTRTVWLDLRVPAEEAALVQIGQEARFRPDGSPNGSHGRIIWISSAVDRQTRTVRVRAKLPNPEGQLRNEAFGLGEIVLRSESEAIVVPETAVQWDGENSLVFVRDARFFEKDRPKFFVARSVRVGVSQDGFTEIIAGVLPGEIVVSKGADVLRAQLLKNNLGAGCTCGH